MRLTVLQVAYPFAPVGPDAVGGAEQVLAQLDAALVARGHRSIVVACAGSAPRGELVASVPAPEGVLTPARIAAGQDAHRRAVEAAIARHAPDIVHLHGLDHAAYMPAPGPPALVTLHLPPDWYPPGTFRPMRPRTWLNPVSHAQHLACPVSSALLPPIPNGVPVAALATRVAKRDHALCLGRICAEKNQHQALEAGRLAGMKVLLGGQVFPYPAHAAYWRAQVAPLLGAPHRFLGPLDLARKRRWLGSARCLVSASLAPETSCLVAMEAMACGTPVVAFPSGALPEIVRHGVTGFLVESVREMALAMRDAHRLDPDACREEARRRFDAEAMADRYLDLYAKLARHAVPA
jgi:glycosyltransferase involved in cell wall biosynthesis